MAQAVPQYEVDPYWPKPLPENWIIGQVAGVAVDRRNNVWIVHRPRSLTERETGAAQDPPIAECCFPAPPVLQFDPDGHVVRAWGARDGERWPVTEHGLYVDGDDNVWTGGINDEDHVIFKSTADGERLLTIGQWGETGGSNDKRLLGRAADVAVDEEANEAYIADGYANRRVVVFDAETGAYKRHWGAYGEAPHDDQLPPYDPDGEVLRSFRSPVHAVRISNDGLVYTADRTNNRVQVFRKNGEFVAESFFATRTLAMGAVWDLEFSPDPEQTYLYVPDGTNMKVWILTRRDLQVVGAFGHPGRLAGYFEWVHSLAGDANGNLFTGEVNTGKRLQRFVRVK